MQFPNLSANQLELLFESSPECLCLLHFEGKFLKTNPAFSNTSGYSNHELVSRPFTDFVHSQDREFTGEILGRMRAGEAAITFENRFELKNLQHKRFLWNCYAIPQHELYYCTAKDISGKPECFGQSGQAESEKTAGGPIRKKQEIDMQHLAEDYKVMFANNPLPMWAYDLDQLKILMVNDAALSLYGYNRKEFLALDLYDLRPEGEHERLRQELKDKYIYHDLKLSSEWQHKKKDGSIIYVDIASHIIRLSEHRARLIVANNITDRRKAQEKLLNQNKQLREIAQLSSHELRGPVASILGLVSMFDESCADPNLNSQIIKKLELCAKDMDKVIHAIVKKTYQEGI
ncbi:PAS domain S-box protein [Flavihumibacter sp. R14]|nr:PAS domain S-box protein [Flavihumibacter soli]